MSPEKLAYLRRKSEMRRMSLQATKFEVPENSSVSTTGVITTIKNTEQNTVSQSDSALGRRITKPRISITELAEKRRCCQEKKRQGLPCKEFQTLTQPEPQSQAASPEGKIGGSAITKEVTSMRKLTWACGLTTVTTRRRDLLPRTLESLKKSGFANPVLFIDGATHQDAISYEQEFGLACVPRYPLIKTFGNWILGLAELYIRNPLADRYAMFQDDLVCSRNLREYLERCEFPDGEHGRPKGYWNLYTFEYNWARAPRDLTVKRERRKGWFPTNGKGLGAVALVFSREGVWDLLAHRGNIITRPTEPTAKAWSAIDGAIVDALKKQGYREYCHNPSLVQHTGLRSSMGNMTHPRANSFEGEDYDLLQLLKR